FVQHVNGWTPCGDFTDKHGDGIHHLGFKVAPQNFDERVAWLERHGGTCIAGGAETFYAEVEFRNEIGITLEGRCPPDKNDVFGAVPVVLPGLSSSPGALSNRRVTHIGIVVSDVDRAARAYADLFDVEMPRIRNGTPHFPVRAHAGAGAAARIATLRQSDV